MNASAGDDVPWGTVASLPVPAFDLVMPAVVSSLRPARDQLDHWLVSAGAAAEDRDAIRLAAVELVTNAIEHAYPAGVTGPFRLRATLSGQGELEVQVSDHGRWQEPDGAQPDRGYGLMVAGQLADRLQVDATPESGTTVTLRRQLSRRPVLSADPVRPGSASAAAGQDLAVEVRWDGTEPVALVRGPVDAGTAQLLLRRLLAACRGGTLPLTVDLCLASQLASAGVRALFQLRSQLARHGRPLTLRAEGNAREVLRRAGLGLPWRSECLDSGAVGRTGPESQRPARSGYQQDPRRRWLCVRECAVRGSDRPCGHPAHQGPGDPARVDPCLDFA